MNIFKVNIITELDCDIDEGEYSIHIVDIIEGWVSEDDFNLIKECIEENIETIKLPKEGLTEIILKETGEREDVFWLKYYEIKN